MFNRIRNWMVDTYNGLYVIVLKPYMPSYTTVVAVVLAFLFGILWAYGLKPVQYYDGAPNQMSTLARDEWVKLVAGSFYGQIYGEEEVKQLLGMVENPAEVVNRLLPDAKGTIQASLQAIQPLAQQINGTPAPRPGRFLDDLINILLPLILVIIGALIISPVWQLLIKPNIWDVIYEALRSKTDEEVEEKKRQKENLMAIRHKKEEEQQMRLDTASAAATNPYGAPLMQKLSIYTKGRAFDDSFAIEDANDMFLGESGATIAKTIGETNELAAVEVWLFDKEDFVRTLNKLLVTEHAFNDPMLRAELEARVDNPATDIVVARPGTTITVETDALMLQAKVVDMKYGDNGIQPPNSFFETLKLQVEAWEKKGGGGMKTMPVAPMSAAVPAMAPPPPAPAFAQPAAPAYTPLPPTQMPPPPPPRTQPQDDDPFGGTGDFTPIGS
ncbi:MAG: hypothetical protein H7X77_01290 [Anaerolineae bacterium]|nr:hypothetical protein [Anaerolineae bacterium]